MSCEPDMREAAVLQRFRITHRNGHLFPEIFLIRLRPRFHLDLLVLGRGRAFHNPRKPLVHETRYCMCRLHAHFSPLV